ncbi:MAG: hypothetical protein BAJATHORv1_30116 [Candidatus Thorarchaeota archaeon]|nr:MAG: hypothetical protein BAJATHORv1_30116 [Candidatus Thorarchaeota archaeon]
MSQEPIRVPLIPTCSACIIDSLTTLVPLLTDDAHEQFRLFQLAFKKLAEGFEKQIEPAPLSIELYQMLYTEANVTDPYEDIKRRSIQAAEQVLPAVEKHIENLEGYERLRAGIAAAITGNVIDFNTAGHRPDFDKLEDQYQTILAEGFVLDDSEELWWAIKSQKGTVVFLGDNAGENLFDIPLLRILKDHGWYIIYVVKGKAMINDATEEDLKGTEIEKLAEIKNSGAWAHGVPMQLVSREFLETIAQADLVISKGQANIETFPEIQRELKVETYYISRAKCVHISQSIGASKGDNIVLRRPATE